MLTLFDIDGTLLLSEGAGMRALVAGGRSLFGDAFTSEGIEYAGRIDPLIVLDVLRANDVEPTTEHRSALRDAYARELAVARYNANALPGVHALLDALEAVEDHTLGLLTGNFEETGSMKLRAAGIDPDRFRVRVWGDHSPHDPPSRDHLGHVGLSLYERLHGITPPPERVWIVGDTVHDVACARAAGCRVIGVATGRSSVSQLSDAGADAVFEDLTDTEEVLTWLTNEK